MYTLIAGTQNVSSWSLRPYLALLATGAPFTMEVIRLRQGDASKQAILAHSPAGKVPVLKFEDQVLWDSLAICETLAERHSEAKLWPADPKARALARSYACEMHSGFPDLRDQLSMDFGRRLETPDLRDTTKAQIARIIAAWEDALNTHGKDGAWWPGWWRPKRKSSTRLPRSDGVAKCGHQRQYSATFALPRRASRCR
jgi:glutathione S-transferase